MKFSAVGLLLLAAIVGALRVPAAVYDLSCEVPLNHYPVHVSKHAGTLYLADKMNLADDIAIDDEDLQDINELSKSSCLTDKPKLLVSVITTEDPAALMKKKTPTFYIGHGGPGHKLLHMSHPHHLSKEISAVGNAESVDKLREHFVDFEDKMVASWSKFTGRGGQIGAQGTINLDLKDSRVPHINDKHFINDIVALSHLKGAVVEKDTVVFAEVHSLVSMARKLGTDATSYKVARRAVVDVVQALQNTFDVTLVVKPVHHHKKHHNGVLQLEHLEKRGRELEEVFSLFSKRASSDSACFSSQEACGESTGQCSGHGECKKLQGGCWQCVCKASFNKEKSKTTKWTGYNCGRKDVSSSAHLLLWTSVALTAALVGGVKLLVSIGSDPLPGVLDAATTVKKAA